MGVALGGAARIPLIKESTGFLTLLTSTISRWTNSTADYCWRKPIKPSPVVPWCRKATYADYYQDMDICHVCFVKFYHLHCSSSTYAFCKFLTCIKSTFYIIYIIFQEQIMKLSNYLTGMILECKHITKATTYLSTASTRLVEKATAQLSSKRLIDIHNKHETDTVSSLY